MSTYRNLIRPIAGDSKVVLEFFVNFSRFEYALKRAGFVEGDRNENAFPDWGKFASSLNGQFASATQPAFTKAKSSLLKDPPNKQMFRKSHMLWGKNSKRSKESDEEYVLRLVRDVRNNLFHGGKYPVPLGPITDPARNSELLRACLTILDKCLQLDADVKHCFEES